MGACLSSTDSASSAKSSKRPKTLKDIEAERRRDGNKPLSHILPPDSSSHPNGVLSPRTPSVASSVQNGNLTTPVSNASPINTAAGSSAQATVDNPFEAPLDSIREEERPYYHLADITHFDVGTLRRLHEIFTAISESVYDDGIIDAAELTAAMGLNEKSLLARAIFKIFDVTETKKINFRTWVTTLSALSNRATLDEKIRFSFSVYDLNGDGCIDVNELRTLLEAAVRENVLSLTDEEVRAICDHTLKNVDKDNNGTVDYSEYREVVQQSSKFLSSFTLDIQRLCGSFRRSRKSNGMTAEEETQKMRFFKSRQKPEEPENGNALANVTEENIVNRGGIQVDDVDAKPIESLEELEVATERRKKSIP